MEKRYHFRGQWKNGDPLVICSYGKNKKDAFIKMLQARKSKKIKYGKGDGFHMSYVTNEEVYTNARKKGLTKTEASILSVYGHTSYVIANGKVHMN